jgi:transposase InsO family protein
MGATGICFDNSPAEAFFASLKRQLVHRRRFATHAEAFFASLKRELVHRRRFATHAEARREIIHWTEGWYNARRLHSSIAYMTPNEKEAA